MPTSSRPLPTEETWKELLTAAGIIRIGANPIEGVSHYYYWIAGERHLDVESRAPRFMADVTAYTTCLQEWIFTSIVRNVTMPGAWYIYRNPADPTHSVRVTRLQADSNNVKLRIDPETGG